MEFEKILELIKAVSDSSLTHFQMEDGELKLSLKTDKAAKGAPAVVEQAQGLGGLISPGQYFTGYGVQPNQAAGSLQAAAFPAGAQFPAAQSLAAQDLAAQALAAQSPAAQGTEESGQPACEGQVIKAPLVGTFYQSASPDDEAFVQVGDVVKKGQTLGIVEAMKLMNEIESEFDGTVVQILVENEQVVEYGQPLFVIR